MRNSFRHISVYIFLTLIALLCVACGSERGDDVVGEGRLVINEIMASNRSGLTASDGIAYDWIELKNISDDSLSLHGLTLCLCREGKDAKRSALPDVTLQSGECVVVYASKKDGGNAENELHVSFKVPAEGATLQLLNQKDSVISEVSYADLRADLSCMRMEDGRYEKSYMQSPGFDNTINGYVRFMEQKELRNASPLKIWEIQPNGSSEVSGWIEIRNVSDDTIHLGDYQLATKPALIGSWQFPSVDLMPGKVFVVDCNKDLFHIGGAKTILLSKNGHVVDGLCAAAVPCGCSMGRKDGSAGFFYFSKPTKGSADSNGGFRFVAAKPQFSCAPGVYDNTDSLCVKIMCNGSTVHYTTDGSMPTLESAVWEEDDSICMTNTTVLRAYTEGDSLLMQSNVLTGTFFINENHTLPVVSVVVANDDLYDYNTGIYATGPGASSEYPHMGANYWHSWTKRAHVEFYDQNGSFEADCGLAISGGYSRAEVKKSFKIKFKDIYGPSHIDYDIFDEGTPVRMKNFILRSGSQDIAGVMVRDEFFTSLMKSQSESLLVQPYRPVALYVNGGYFGLYYVREKIDKHFVARHLNVTTDSVSIIMSKGVVEEGNGKDYRALMSYVRTHNLADKDAYEYVCDKVDIDGLIDHKLGEIYTSNTDVGNVRYVRSTDSACDKKWHFVYYDLDATWVVNQPSTFYLRTGGVEGEADISQHNLLVANLLKNAGFRQRFLKRLSFHLHKTFTPEYTTRMFDELIERIKPEMKRNCERWPGLMAYSTWEKNVEKFRKKFERKHEIILKDIRNTLRVTPEEDKLYFQ